ncbi:hypothetical protein PRIPAC_71961 [Pristionchus pacificus]|nr:hypothetical protein PRIPAC_71961 [Pristionchus pacificus]
MTDKRYDIQGLRAWAVIAVVTFHFFPSLLPFGYLGVDVFFVLSGFLISLVLENKEVAISTYINFYFKRTRRIFPLLLLIVLFCSIYSFLYYGNTLFMYSEKSALHAALFMTNLKGRNEGEDYFRDIEKVDDFYTHTWSLSVEIQFYLIAPVLLHSLKPSCSDSSFVTAYFILIAGFSNMFSKAINPSAAFYSPIARLWQFIAGAIAFQLQNIDYLPLAKEPETPQTNFSPVLSRFDIVIPSILSLCVLACDIAFNNLESACRDAVTIGAALVLVLKLTSPILTHRALQIIGDSSYALYLIHWPVVCVLKYHECDRWTDRLLAMILCFALSVLVYNFYETWYLTLSEKGTFILIGILYLSCASVYFFYHKIDKEEMVLGTTVKALSFGEARLINLQMDMQWENNLKLANCTFRDPKVDRNPWGFCNLPQGNGTLSFLIIGNSYAANHGKMVVEHLKDHYGRIAVHTVSECEPLIVTTSPYCSGAVKTQQAFLKDIDTYKPDVLFLSSRYIEPNVPLGTTDVKNDQLYIDMMNKLKKYEEKVKKVFILQSFPRPANLQKIEDIRIAANQTIEGFMEEAIEADSIPMRKRVEELAKNCEKCVIYDVMQLHMDKGRFMVANPVSHLHYFEALRHHTPIGEKYWLDVQFETKIFPGLKLVEPLYHKLSKNFDDLMNSKWPNNVVKVD